MNNYNYEEIKYKFNENEINFGIELSRARKFLISGTDDSTRLLIWSFINYILLPIFIFFISVFKLGLLWGILYSFIYYFFLFSVSGYSSLNFSKAYSVIFIFCAIFIVLYLFIGTNIRNMLIPFFLALINYFSIYYFYNNIGKTLINKYILKDKTMFDYLLENEIFTIKNKEAN